MGWVACKGCMAVCALGPQLEVSGQLGSLHLLLTPRQLQQLQKLLSAINLAGEAAGQWVADGARSRDNQAGCTETSSLQIQEAWLTS